MTFVYTELSIEALSSSGGITPILHARIKFKTFHFRLQLS